MLICLLILTLSKTFAIFTRNYTCYLKDKRLSGFYHQGMVAEKILCANSCYIDGGCVGLAYHDSTQMCYLYDEFPSGQSPTLDTGIVTYLLQDSIPQNIAFKKHTSMSSTFDIHVSLRAVDGDLTTLSHTHDSPLEWWCVDLWKIYNFNVVVIQHSDPGDSYGNRQRIKGFELRLSDNGQCNLATLNGTILCYKDPLPSAPLVYNITSCNQPAVSFSSRFIFVKIQPRKNLHIREMVVTSSDPPC